MACDQELNSFIRVLANQSELLMRAETHKKQPVGNSQSGDLRDHDL